MRFVLAIVFFVLALGTMGTGIAERTFLAGPDQVTLATTASHQAPVVVIDGAALNAYPEAQTVKMAGSPTSFAAYGRTSDVLAWIGNTNYTEVSLNPKTDELQSKFHHGEATKVPNPSGSDLWLQQYKFGEFAQFRAKVPASMSVIAVSNGKDAGALDCFGDLAAGQLDAVGRHPGSHRRDRADHRHHPAALGLHPPAAHARTATVAAADAEAAAPAALQDERALHLGRPRWPVIQHQGTRVPSATLSPIVPAVGSQRSARRMFGDSGAHDHRRSNRFAEACRGQGACRHDRAAAGDRAQDLATP